MESLKKKMQGTEPHLFPIKYYAVRCRWPLQPIPPASQRTLCHRPGRLAHSYCILRSTIAVPFPVMYLHLHDAHFLLGPSVSAATFLIVLCCFSKMSNLPHSFIQQICNGWHNIRPGCNGYTMIGKRVVVPVLMEEVTQLKARQLASTYNAKY